MSEYKPVACSFYDYLESAIVKRQKVNMIFLDDNNKEIEINELLLDVFSKEKSEYVKTESSITIRLDKILKLDGIENSSSCSI